MICIDKIYDPEFDIWWALFIVKDLKGNPIQFRMPVPENHFEIGKIYKLSIKEIDKIYKK